MLKAGHLSCMMNIDLNGNRGGHDLLYRKVSKVVMRSRKSKDRKYNGPKKKNEQTNNELQNNIQKTKD